MFEQIEIVEVSPRDGLQNERQVVPTGNKIALIERAVAAGLRRMEIASFVNAARVPQMADAEAVIAGTSELAGLRSIGLVLNRRGLERALRTRVHEINVVVVASESFSQRNQGAGIAATVAGLADMAAIVKHEGRGLSVTIAAAFGCPFEGEVPVARVTSLVAEVAAFGPDEIALADTIGVASPYDVIERFQAAQGVAPGVAWRAHFHNTRNTGIANAFAALQCGVRVLDASIGGIGGCPFAPAATGNIATEDLLYMMRRMGCAPPVDMAGLLDIAAWLEGRIGHAVPAMLGRAGIFPP